MLMSSISRLLSAWFAFLLPCYATFKALSHRPLSEPDLLKLAMYWAVIGAFMTYEYVAEWTISWFPFYWEIKTLFLLFLSLPQTQGSTYIYNTYLQPFFSRNEADLDAGIIAMQRNVLTFVQVKLSAVWDLFWNIATGNRAPSQAASSTSTPATFPQVAQFLSTDAWRSAVNFLQPSPASATATKSPSLSSSRKNSFTGSSASTPAGEPAAPPFPVPQHFQ